MFCTKLYKKCKHSYLPFRTQSVNILNNMDFNRNMFEYKMCTKLSTKCVHYLCIYLCSFEKPIKSVSSGPLAPSHQSMNKQIEKKMFYMNK